MTAQCPEEDIHKLYDDLLNAAAIAYMVPIRMLKGQTREQEEEEIKAALEAGFVQARI